MKYLFSIFILTLASMSFAKDSISIAKHDEIQRIAREVAAQFDYYNEISTSAANLFTSTNEIGGQCGDYAVAFANAWNSRHKEPALIVIQQQDLNDFPDGIYEILGKDTQKLSFLDNRRTSMLYKWNNVLGVGHPKLGGYKIRLVEEVSYRSHFNIKNWKNNGPHVWVKIGDISVDPTYTDIGGAPTMGIDKR